jgi:hypothetical protein
MDSCELLLVHLNAEVDRRNSRKIAAGAAIYLAQYNLEQAGIDSKVIRQMMTTAASEAIHRYPHGKMEEI